MAWLYMPDMAVSTSQSKSLVPNTELFVTLSGKQVVRPCSWRGWQRRNYIKLLYGTIAEPLTANRGAAKWISSLRDSRALPSVLPAGEKAFTTKSGSGPMWRELFAKWNQKACFLRTYEDLFQQIAETQCETFSQTWPAWGLMLSGEVFRLNDWAPAIPATASSSWPTPTARNEKGGGNTVTRKGGKSRLDMLDYAAEQWATPKAMTGGANSNRAQRAGTGGPDLQEQVSLWATPIANDAEKRGQIAPEQNKSLTGMAVDFHSRRLDLMKIKNGSNSLETLKPRLNPLFTEWLMGLPKGWTDYECAETGLTRWLAHMRGVLDRHCSPESGARYDG